MVERTPITAEEINAARSEAGGFNRETLRQWGITWPPPKGWYATILAHGIPYDASLNPEANRGVGDPHELLRKVVLAVVEAGHASDLYEFPDVLAYFGAANPEPNGEESA